MTKEYKRKKKPHKKMLSEKWLSKQESRVSISASARQKQKGCRDKAGMSIPLQRGLSGAQASSAIGQGWLKPSCESGRAQDVLVCTVRATQGLGRCKAPPQGSPGATFALLLCVFGTARDECGRGSRRSLPATGGDTQPWQAQVVDTLTAPSADLCAGALRSRRPSPQCSQQPPSAATACGRRSPPQIKGRSLVLPVPLAAGLSKAVPVPWFPKRGMEQE